ncbi:hypothetical protein EYF80_019075 [Liparis tanakae]|uniref:Uncharacterized protein n=1 Tax=Liparis tanakae TaxID=230148 RepID=A0A4Z2HY97_9TELE|nr:hypothetical protein EYF80_019075 [Liparis tanakae]
MDLNAAAAAAVSIDYNSGRGAAIIELALQEQARSYGWPRRKKNEGEKEKEGRPGRALCQAGNSHHLPYLQFPPAAAATACMSEQIRAPVASPSSPGFLAAEMADSPLRHDSLLPDWLVNSHNQIPAPSGPLWRAKLPPEASLQGWTGHPTPRLPPSRNTSTAQLRLEKGETDADVFGVSVATPAKYWVTVGECRAQGLKGRHCLISSAMSASNVGGCEGEGEMSDWCHSQE